MAGYRKEYYNSSYHEMRCMLSSNIFNGLTDLVRGKVTVYVDDDDILNVIILMGDLKFVYQQHNVSNKVMFGELNSNNVIFDVVEKYRHYIHNRIDKQYFRTVEQL